MNGEALLLCCIWAVLLSSTVQCYENLALKKEAWLSSGFDHTAEFAVDGLKQNLTWDGGQCAWSSYTWIAEWRVDLGGFLSIHHIFIQYGTDNRVWDATNSNTRSFLGFSLYISNTTNKEDGVLCFRDKYYTIETIPNPVNITCPYYGRYVIYYNNRTHPPYPDWYSGGVWTYLCEVEVYGCPTPGYYGEKCSTLCPQDCQEGRCHITEGTCLGCPAGYRGLMCNNECPIGLFGANCEGVCSPNCKTPGICDKVTGRCEGGCQSGWTQHKCDSACSDGSFGRNCIEKCGKCLGKEQCDHVNGTCVQGCNPGYHGIMCTEVCSNGTFGQDCNEQCGECLGKEQCDHVNGTCVNGCNSGYQGIMCTEGGQS
uniref:Scavenger receptor class F member 2-like n=1 Tax=Crassostrea virginica TaxID=6565 RepID=A0A8B8C1Y8_CRAVI|nr:scavenger receptor class F member 2-like [Crassostrea virginica]